VDLRAARNARRKAIKADLTQAYDDEEASPPEWVDLHSRAREASAKIVDEVRAETAAFVEDPDIRTALARRTRAESRLRTRIEEHNRLVRRLNLIAPSARFTRPALDADEVLRPLFRAKRPADS
jgi:hypothetical protein